MLVLKNTGTGELLRVRTPLTRYRVGQSVDLNTEATRMALTPFPVEYQKKNPKMHQNDAWKMRTVVSISAEGRIDGQTHISSDSQLGYTGGVEILLLDRSTNILHHTNLRTYSVNANSDRTVDWHETAPLTAVNKVRAVVIHHSHDPKVRLAAGMEWLKENSHDVSRVLTCTQSKDRDKGAPAGLRPSPGNQPSASIMHCS